MSELLAILQLENDSNFLPQDVKQVVLALIEKRIDLFSNAAQRYSNQYIR